MILHKFNQKGYDAYKKLIEDIQSSVEKENNDLSKGYTDELKQRVKDLQLDKSVQEKFEHNISIDVKSFDSRHKLGIYLISYSNISRSYLPVFLNNTRIFSRSCGKIEVKIISLLVLG